MRPSLPCLLVAAVSMAMAPVGRASAAQVGPAALWATDLPVGAEPLVPIGAARRQGLRTEILLGSADGHLALITLGPDGDVQRTLDVPALAPGAAVVAGAPGVPGQWHIALRVPPAASGPQGSGLALGGDDIVHLRLDDTGALLSAERLGTSRDDRPRALVSAPDGGAFLAGTTVRSGFSFSGAPARTVGFVARLDPAGQPTWSRIVPGLGQPGSNMEVVPRCIAHDPAAGLLHLGGEARSNPGAPRQTALLTLTEDGTFVDARYGDLSRGTISAAAVDGQGGLLLGCENDLTRGTEVMGVDAGVTWRQPLSTPPGPWGRARITALTRAAGVGGAVAFSSTTGHLDPTLGSSVRLDLIGAGGSVTAIHASAPAAGTSTTSGILTGAGDGAVVGVGLRDGDPTALLVLAPSPFAPGCPGAPHGAGHPALVRAAGSGRAADAPLLLAVEGAPPLTYGIFLCSPLPGHVPGAGGGTGTLCLGGGIGRFDAPAEIWQADHAGGAWRVVSLDELPTPGLPHAAVAGETWHFQAWFRDGASTGFSSSLAVEVR